MNDAFLKEGTSTFKVSPSGLTIFFCEITKCLSVSISLHLTTSLDLFSPIFPSFRRAARPSKGQIVIRCPENSISSGVLRWRGFQIPLGSSPSTCKIWRTRSSLDGSRGRGRSRVTVPGTDNIVKRLASWTPFHDRFRIFGRVGWKLENRYQGSRMDIDSSSRFRVYIVQGCVILCWPCNMILCARRWRIHSRILSTFNSHSVWIHILQRGQNFRRGNVEVTLISYFRRRTFLALLFVSFMGWNIIIIRVIIFIYGIGILYRIIIYIYNILIIIRLLWKIIKKENNYYETSIMIRFLWKFIFLTI